MSHSKRSSRYSYLTISIIFLSALFLTAYIYTISKKYYDDLAQQRFQIATDDIRRNISKRMLGYEHALRSGIGFFQASDDVTKAEWKLFVETLQTQTFYPGIQGIGFSKMLRPEEVAPTEEKMRQEGHPSFTVKPVGKRDLYSAILYLEPLDKRNAEAIGYDMFSQVTRKAAMERARDTGLPSVSGRVTLVQEIDDDVQAGILMYLPLYQKNMPLSSVEDRRQALIGYVYSPFRMGDLMRPALISEPYINFEIFDTEHRSDADLLYRSFTPSDYASRFQNSIMYEIGGQNWKIFFYSTPEFDMDSASNTPLIIGLSGLLFSSMLLVILLIFAHNRKVLERKNKELKRSKDHLQTLLSSSTDGIHILSHDGDLFEYSVSFLKMLGYSQEEAVGLNISDWDITLTKERVAELIEKSKDDSVHLLQTKHRKKDGKVFDVEITAKRIVLDDTLYLYASSRDITEKLLQQDLLLQNLRFASMADTISMIAHQWRQPLASIAAKGTTLLVNLELEKLDKEDIHKNIMEIQDLVQELSQTITSFRDFVEADASNEFFKLSDTIDETLKMLPANLKQSLTLEFDKENDLVISGARQEFKQVLISLLENAVTSVQSIQNIREPHLSISALYDKGDITIRICDNGMGIDPEIQERIFDPYFTTKEVKNTAGLGLYVSKAIIEKHFNGQIRFIPTEVGACFELLIPSSTQG